MKENNCIDCGIRIYRSATRCKSCYQKGELNHFYGKSTPILGKFHSEETRKKMSESLRGCKCYSWKGGISSINNTIRRGIEYRLWRESVFARDNWTCQKCKIKGGYLHSHHINNFAEIIELRTSIENGITFCKECHMTFHNKYGRKNNTREQVEEFLKL